MVINKEQTCRVCLIENKPDITDINNIQSIFDKDDENIEISAKLSVCGGLNIISDDEKPTGICRNCSEILQVSYNFREICQSTEHKLNQLLNYSNEVILFKEEVEEDIEDSNQKLINSEMIPEETTSKRSKRRTVLNNQQKIKIENDLDEEYVSNYINDEELEEKMIKLKSIKQKRKKKGTKIKLEIEGLILDTGKYDDDQDDNQDEDTENLKKEKRKYVRKKPRKHEPKLPPTIEELTCDICRNVFKNKKLLAVHVKLVHVGKKDFICETCGASFANQFKLLCHRHTHTGARPYPCRYCEKAFRNSSNRRVHEMRMHTHIKPFSCEFCGKDWHTSHQLKKHRRVHTGEKPYICSVCGTGFKARNHLNAHMKSLVPCIVKMNLKKQNEQINTLPSSIPVEQNQTHNFQILKKKSDQINTSPSSIAAVQNQTHNFQSMQTIQSSIQSPASSSLQSINSSNTQNYQ